MRHSIRLTAVAGLFAFASFAHAAERNSPLVRQARHRLGKRSAAHRQRPHRRHGVRRRRFRAPADLREIPVDRRARHRGRLRLRPAGRVAGRAHALHRQTTRSTARSSSPKTWPSSLAARCTTTATTRASATSSSSVKPTATPVTDYRRELDLDTRDRAREIQAGRCRVSPRIFRLVSRPGAGGALVRHQRAEAARAIRGARQSQRRRSRVGRQRASSISGALKSNGLKYAAELRVIAGVRHASTPTATRCASRANARSPSCWPRAPTTACSTRTIATPARIRWPACAEDTDAGGKEQFVRYCRAPHARITRRCSAAWR